MIEKVVNGSEPVLLFHPAFDALNKLEWDQEEHFNKWFLTSAILADEHGKVAQNVLANYTFNHSKTMIAFNFRHKKVDVISATGEKKQKKKEAKNRLMGKTLYGTLLHDI